MAVDTHTLQGADDLLARLKALPPEIASSKGGPARAALAKAARLIRDEAIQRAPEDTGNLKDNIIMKRDPNPKRSGANEIYWVGVRGGGRRKYANTKRNRRNKRTGQTYEVAGNAYYWRFFEFGSEKLRPQPFLRPAFEARAAEAEAVIIDGLDKGITRIVRKLGGRA